MSQSDQPRPEVHIRTYRLARDELGAKGLTREIDADETVGSFLESLNEEYGIDPDNFLVMVNGRHTKQLEGDDTPLRDGDSITLSVGSINE